MKYVVLAVRFATIISAAFCLKEAIGAEATCWIFLLAWSVTAEV